MITLGVIGTGNMGKAIINGVLNSNFSKEIKIFAYDKNSSSHAELKQKGIKFTDTAIDIVKSCTYVLLAVKPQNIEDLLSEIKNAVTEKTVFISICAGISAEYIEQRTLKDVKVILVMPNTPMMLGVGASAVSKNNKVSESEFKFAMSIFESCGLAVEIPIGKMKEIIAINGSSPAFIYLFAKGFIDYAKSVDIDENSALKLFAKSLEGSAKMITSSGMSIDELIQQVSSPGGTTIAGLEEFLSNDLTGIVKKAASSCTKRAYELQK